MQNVLLYFKKYKTREFLTLSRWPEILAGYVGRALHLQGDKDSLVTPAIPVGLPRMASPSPVPWFGGSLTRLRSALTSVPSTGQMPGVTLGTPPSP